MQTRITFFFFSSSFLFGFRVSTMASEGYRSIPQEGSEPNVNRVKPYAYLSKLKEWLIGHDPSENVSILNRQRMTLEPPRKSPARIIFQIVSLVALFVLVLAVLLFSYGIGEQQSQFPHVV